MITVRELQSSIRGSKVADIAGGLNEFDRRANEMALAFPRLTHEVNATRDLVDDTDRLVVIGHQLLDIVYEHAICEQVAEEL